MAQRADIVVVGAGIGGLSSAVELAVQGYDVTVVDKAEAVGGKMRTIEVDGRPIDSGPTVFTMRDVFEGLFNRAGMELEEAVTLLPLEVLARHAWTDGARLDLFVDPDKSAAAIEAAFGRREADGFRRFCAHTERIYETVKGPFIYGDAGGLMAMMKQLSFGQLRRMATVDFHRSMWRALRSFFRDPRLQQLFGRYGTYYGSSPFKAPATLNLIAHVEQRGVWAVKGGMIELAKAMAEVVRKRGGEIRLGSPVEEVLLEGRRAVGVRLAGGEEIRSHGVVLNVAPEAVANGMLGDALRSATQPSPAPRSLSAVTWSAVGRVRDFPLAYHNVFFSNDYPHEFDQLGSGEIPDPPTVYLCAQDRDPSELDPGLAPAPQRLFWLVNSPARGDDPAFSPEIDRCTERSLEQMARCGVTVEVEASQMVCTTPREFERMFPGTGGALYGPATHSLAATFSRPGARTRVEGLYLAGGGAHPGAGVPMVALGGRLAARSAHEDLASTLRSRRAGTSGGTSTGSVAMAARP